MLSGSMVIADDNLDGSTTIGKIELLGGIIVKVDLGRALGAVHYCSPYDLSPAHLHNAVEGTRPRVRSL